MAPTAVRCGTALANAVSCGRPVSCLYMQRCRDIAAPCASLSRCCASPRSVQLHRSAGFSCLTQQVDGRPASKATLCTFCSTRRSRTATRATLRATAATASHLRARQPPAAPAACARYAARRCLSRSCLACTAAVNLSPLVAVATSPLVNSARGHVCAHSGLLWAMDGDVTKRDSR